MAKNEGTKSRRKGRKGEREGGKVGEKA